MYFAKSIIFSLFLLFFCAADAQAQLKGQTEEAFQTAVSDWLNGDDLRALLEFRRLAKTDNRAAQILIASIALRLETHSHVTTSFSRKEIIELFRIPHGISGKSWLVEAQEDEPLAIALSQAKKVREKTAAGLALLNLGEPLAGLDILAQSLSHSGGEEVLKVLKSLENELPVEANGLVFLAGQYGFERPMDHSQLGALLDIFGMQDPTENTISQLAWEIFLFPKLREDHNRYRAALEYADRVQTWTPMRNFCERHCADQINSCTVNAVSFFKSGGRFPFRSPLQSVISNEEYWSSPRMEGDLARGFKDLNTYGWDIDELCFAKAMKRAQAEHRPSGK